MQSNSQPKRWHIRQAPNKVYAYIDATRNAHYFCKYTASLCNLSESQGFRLLKAHLSCANKLQHKVKIDAAKEYLESTGYSAIFL